MIRVLLINNYDSFTFNLVQVLRESGLCNYEVMLNDEIQVEDCEDFDKILISPGPGLPAEAGVTCDVIRHWASEKSIFGVCLGHQAVAEVFGARLKQLPHPKHGQKELVEIISPETKIFRDLPANFETGHYHSWIVDNEGLPESLNVTARDKAGNIMAISHRTFDVHGVQFHPESIMTSFGRQIVLNWLKQ
ncbi:MAG: aminodeoxychorismate/anthranilate synthase component II [Bacteroidales bacterium]|nr:aminodeoxychorismate/anthranilate synthase component II [Bacteroidales bacterium]